MLAVVLGVGAHVGPDDLAGGVPELQIEQLVLRRLGGLEHEAVHHRDRAVAPFALAQEGRVVEQGRDVARLPDHLADFVQEGDHYFIGHPGGVLDFVLAGEFGGLVRHGLAEALPVGGFAVLAMAILLSHLHSLVGTVEVHDIHRVLRQHLAHQRADHVAHRRIQAAFEVAGVAVVLGGHRGAIGRAFAPLLVARIFRRRVHEGMVERYVGDQLEASLPAQARPSRAYGSPLSSGCTG